MPVELEYALRMPRLTLRERGRDRLEITSTVARNAMDCVHRGGYRPLFRADHEQSWQPPALPGFVGVSAWCRAQDSGQRHARQEPSAHIGYAEHHAVPSMREGVNGP